MRPDAEVRSRYRNNHNDEGAYGRTASRAHRALARESAPNQSRDGNRGSDSPNDSWSWGERSKISPRQTYAPKNETRDWCQKNAGETPRGGLWSVDFHTVLLATFDERDYIIQS